MLPETLRAAVEARFGPVRAVQPVAGGSINHAARVELSSGPVFLKYSAAAPEAIFAIEADGLAALAAAAGDLRVPEVLALRDAGPGGIGWLALEWLEPGPPSGESAARLGTGLAAMHRTAGAGWGWERDGFIGSLPQPNEPASTWAEFWRTRRLQPQLDLAREAGRLPGAPGDWSRLMDRLPDLLAPAEDEGPSLLHGDLWSGNVLALRSGQAALVDPAAYRGHREVDLAMSELFGGFAPEFYRAYRAAWPLAPGYVEARRGVYQLFFLLVHVNLFGGGYVAQSAAVLRRVLAAL